MLLAAALALVLVACRRRPTELILEVDTDLVVPDAIDLLEFSVRGPAGTTSRTEAPLAGPGAIAPPWSLVLYPTGTALGPVDITVTGRLGPTLVIERRARVSFVPEQSPRVHLALRRGCAGVVCPAEQTCVERACEPIDVALDAGTPGTDAALDGGTTVVGLALGDTFSCAVLTNGSVECWGDDGAGQLGTGAATPGPARGEPRAVVGLSDAVEVAAGADFACARRADGTVVCWGDNSEAALGTAVPTPARSTRPLMVPGIDDAVQLAAGEHFACARRASGGVTCWGDNGSGQCGVGSTASPVAPTAVAGLSGAVEIRAGGIAACARVASGEVVCWGTNGRGQLGNGTMTNCRAPCPIPSRTDLTQVSIGSGHGCARLASGRVGCWGANDFGQIGNGEAGTGLVVLTPTDVTALGDATQVEAGGAFSCARRTDGTVSCWGHNLSGELGDGTLVNRANAAAVRSLSDAVELATGGQHACARRATGSVVCWGRNNEGQAGTGGTGGRLVMPAQVVNLP